MTETTAASPAVETVMAAAIEIQDFLQLKHMASQCKAERLNLQEAMAALPASLSEHALRVSAIKWALGESVEGELATSKHPLAMMIMSKIKEAGGDTKGALNFAEKAAKAAPTDVACVMGQVGAMRKNGKVEEALELLEKLRREFSDRAEFFFQLGCCYEKISRHEDAAQAFFDAVEINPDHYQAIFHYANLCDLRGDDRTALDYYKKIGPGRNNSFISASLNMALIYEDIGQYDEAVACCKAVIEVSPNNYRAKLFLEDITESGQMYYSPEEAKESERQEALFNIPVSDFELSVRSRNCLARMDINNLGDLVRKTEQEMLAYKNFGETSLREIREMLAGRNLCLGMLAEGSTARPPVSVPGMEGNDNPIEELELSVRSRKCMDRLGIISIGQLISMSEAELMGAKNFGRVSMQEIKAKLHERGLSLKQD